ncbi:MAG: homocysteine biosynthesis protein [Armatimonadota bacterium]|nr:MAG: homocysteine biosynthesis protein [Armatimonadota bacterium]
MPKTYAEINDRIRRGEAVVVTAEEMIDVVKEKGAKEAAKQVDVVTTGTFGAMCSSGAFINIGHAKPRIKLGGGRVTLNGVTAYAGLAAVDLYIGATALGEDDPRNQVFPGEFKYGGGHVIEELVAGKDIRLEAVAYGTDCYPRKRLATWINIADLNEAFLFNPRNGYQNYNVAVNVSDKTIYTYMGVLKPRLGNANYCSAGQLSPLLNDPTYRTIGMGTRIFLGGGVGYVTGKGTQHNPVAPRTDNQVPRAGAGTMAVTGDLKSMSAEWLRGASFQGYGGTLVVGLGIPIPILDEELAERTAVSDADIKAQVIDYSEAYPTVQPGSLAEVSYTDLKSGAIDVNGKRIETVPLSSYPMAKQIAETLKNWVASGQFLLGEPAEALPGPDSGYAFKLLNERPVED